MKQSNNSSQTNSTITENQRNPTFDDYNHHLRDHAFSSYQPFTLSQAYVNNVLLELNLLQQLQASSTTNATLFKPEAMQLVSSSIIVRPYSIIPIPDMARAPLPRTTAEAIEREVESQTMPIVISDSNYKICFANSAYKRLVGQPQCIWIESLGCGGGSCNRICGEVNLQISESVVSQISRENGFFCSVVMEWRQPENNNIVRCSIKSPSEALRLFCESRDYVFAWKFYIQGRAYPMF